MGEHIMLDESWRALAEHLGLEFVEHMHSISGARHGYDVSCHVDSNRTSDRYHVEVRLNPPLDILVGSVSPWSVDRVGDPDDPVTRAASERMAALVGAANSEVRDKLSAADASVEVTDDKVTAWRSMDGYPAERLPFIVDALIAYARSLDAQRSVVPVRPELQRFESAFRDLAKELAFEFYSCPLLVRGASESVDVVAAMIARDGVWQFEVVAEVPTPLLLEVQIRTHRKSLRERLGIASQHDVQLGDRALDDALDVRSDNPGELRRRLTSVHDSLRLLIAGGGTLEVDSRRVRLARGHLIGSAALVRAVAAIASALAGPQAGGAFR